MEKLIVFGCSFTFGENLDEFPENDNSLQARDLIHLSVGQQNFIYEKFKEKYNE